MRIYQVPGILLILCLLFVNADARVIRLASTTSADNSGLYEYLLPEFSKQTGLQVHVIAVGTGRALNIASRGDVDLLVVHDKESELQFVKEGNGIQRKTFMRNNYIIVGPVSDPARIAGMDDIARALQRIADSSMRFISRGDNSGTHKREQILWQLIGGAPDTDQNWYIEVGSGMGQTLNIANQMGAYTLSDSSTWVSFNNRDNLKILVQNQPALDNPYSVILVNPKKHPHVYYAGAKKFSDWLTSPVGLSLIENFRVSGVQLFEIYSESAR